VPNSSARYWRRRETQVAQKLYHLLRRKTNNSPCALREGGRKKTGLPIQEKKKGDGPRIDLFMTRSGEGRRPDNQRGRLILLYPVKIKKRRRTGLPARSEGKGKKRKKASTAILGGI